MTLITMLIVSIATLLAGTVNRRVAGMRLFSFGLLSIWAGAVLGLARLAISGRLIVLACIVLMFGGMVTVVQAIRAFRGFRPLPKTAVLFLVGIVGVFFLYWLFVRDRFAFRVAGISASFALLTGDAAVSMFRKVHLRDRLIYWPTGCAFGLATVYLGARAVAASSGSYGADLLSPVPMELVSNICANIAYVGCAFGMLLASNAQLRRDAERLSLYDPLTNLPNRRLLLDRLLIAERRALAHGLQLGVIYLDLDGFKQVNDTLGHEAGDELLRNVSAAMVRVLRAEDCLARIGGDEFVALVEGVHNRAQILTLAERLTRAVASQPLAADSTIMVRASCGAAVFPEDGLSAHDVMREADAAMYHAKRRNRLAGHASAL